MDAEALQKFLAASDIPLLAATPGADAEDIRQARLSSAAVIIGSEGQGISPQMLSRSEGKIHIPMQGNCESLNAAVAAALVLWEMVR